MKWILIFSALFPFLHEISYDVELVSCQKNQIIIKYQKEEREISLFNVMMSHEHGWNHTCALLEASDQISIEIDNSSKIDEIIPAYVFIDKELLQKKLIDEKWAVVMVNNPNYKYSYLMNSDNEIKTMASINNNMNRENDYHGLKHVAFYYAIWLSGLFIYILMKKTSHKVKSKL